MNSVGSLRCLVSGLGIVVGLVVWLPAAPAVGATAPRDVGASAFAIELGTGSLSPGALGGALGLGWAGRTVALGLGLEYTYSSLEGNTGPPPPKVIERQTLVGPWLRWAFVRSFDGRVDLIAAIDAGYDRRAITRKLDTNPMEERAAADGVTFRVGPGIRYWAHPQIALGFTTQLSVTALSGPLLALSSSSSLGSPDNKFDSVQVGLNGRFQLLALF